MNKDAILATIIGFGVGLVIAGLIFLGPTVLKNLPHVSLPALPKFSLALPGAAHPKPTPKTTGTPSDTLTIESPLADSIEPKNELLISGSAAPNAVVVLEGENGEAVVVANNQGAYAAKLTLGEGKNDLVVTSYSGKNVQTQSVTVFYTPENF